MLINPLLIKKKSVVQISAMDEKVYDLGGEMYGNYSGNNDDSQRKAA